MQETAQQEQLAHAIEDVHLDELRHPDPSGQHLLRMMNAIDAHVREEAASIEMYAQIGRDTKDSLVALVMEVLLDDEQRHHALFQRIAASLRDRLQWTTESPRPAHDQTIVNTLRTLEGEERRGAQQLRDLARRESNSQTELECMLLDAMAMDSEKHARLLAFLTTHVRTP